MLTTVRYTDYFLHSFCILNGFVVNFSGNLSRLRLKNEKN